LQGFRDAIERGITTDDYQYYIQLLLKMRMELPDDIREIYEESLEFTKTIKKKCMEKMPLEELEDLVGQVKEHKIITNEMQTLKDQVTKAENWMQRAQASEEEIMSLKSLHALVSEVRAIPVIFGETLEKLKTRLSNA